MISEYLFTIIQSFQTLYFLLSTRDCTPEENRLHPVLATSSATAATPSGEN